MPFGFSLVFYSYGNLKTPLYILLIIISLVFNYIAGIQLRENGKRRFFWFVLSLVFNFGWLLFFKYSYFLHLLPFQLVLPIGISFYTFQTVSYLADAYTLKVKPEKSFLRLSAYIIMFPQLIAGPIVRFSDVQFQLRNRQYKLPRIIDGVRVFVIGLSLKVVLANQIGGLWTDATTIGYDSLSVPYAWLAVMAFSLQLYLDFWGYSLMAIGLGRMIGFELPTNFDSPYCSVSVSEFWRRWHMTLGSWFREYLYIPLGGNRRGKLRTYLNLLIVWLCTGFWHGANWNFILWGLLLYVFIAIERLGLGQTLEEHRALGHIYCLLAIGVTWMFFAIESLPQCMALLGRLIGIGGINVRPGDWLTALRTYWWLLGLGVFASTELPKKLYMRFKEKWIVYPVLAVMLGVSIYCLYMGLNDPFLYFRF
jgi:alginate O-acetyltransferase complex protein AlgI